MKLCRDPSNEYETVQDTCQAKAAIDRHRDDQKRSNTDPEPGEVLHAELEDTGGSSYAVNPFE